MNSDYLRELKPLLEQKRAELRRSVERDGITVERTADEIDARIEANERELVTHNIDRQTSVLHDIEAALRRIETGEFGVCIECAEDIDLKRLEAVPWTPYCLRCREEVDRSEAAMRPGASILKVA